jgi:glycosyltransferase involved in cell wall biosynthesis
MHVLIATFLAPTSPSGVVTYCRTLAADLAGEGVTVRTVDASTTPRWWCRVLGVLGRVLRPFGGAVRGAYDEFAFYSSTYFATRRLRHLAFGVIHAQDVRSGVAAYRALGGRVPVVLTCHFNDDPVTELVSAYGLGSRATRYLTRWYGYLFSFVRNYVFVSNYAYEKSQHLLPVGIEKRILHNTVRLDVALSRAARAASDPLVISNVGYIDERKNQQLLLQIGHELRRRNLSNFAIWLIGDGPKRAEYEALARRLGLGEQVKFYGRQAAPWRLVAQTDLYIHTALNDNCPYSIVEAFAVRTPVLALPVGGVPELLPVDSGPLRGTDVPTLTDQVAAYFDPARRERLAQTQAAFAETHFNHRTALRELITFYYQAAQTA